IIMRTSTATCTRTPATVGNSTLRTAGNPPEATLHGLTASSRRAVQVRASSTISVVMAVGATDPAEPGVVVASVVVALLAALVVSVAVVVASVAVGSATVLVAAALVG